MTHDLEAFVFVITNIARSATFYVTIFHDHQGDQIKEKKKVFFPTQFSLVFDFLFDHMKSLNLSFFSISIQIYNIEAFSLINLEVPNESL